MGLYEAFKDAVTLAQKADNLELVRQLLDVQNELLELTQRLQALARENADLKQRLDLDHDLAWEHNVYWLDRDGKRVGAFCPRCWPDARKLARMMERPEDHYWQCPVCHMIVDKPGPDPAERHGRRGDDGRDPVTGY